METHRLPPRPPGWAPGALCLLITLLAAGCGGGAGSSGDQAGQVNGQFLIVPATATVYAGQAQTFTASGPWGSGATWSVLPASLGTIDGLGRFTAADAAGEGRIVAMWSRDVRYTATATVSVLATPPPAVSSPDFVQASGGQQAAPDGTTLNGAIVGELVPSTQSVTANGFTQVRTGFLPPTPAAAN